MQQHQCAAAGDKLADKPKLKCELCGKEGFPTPYALKCHVAFKHKDASDTVNHVCKVCRKKFNTAQEVDKHKTVCSYEKNVKVSKRRGELWCELCMIKFDNNALLRKHIDAVHKDCENFECKSCCGIFLKKSTYDSHFCMHTLYRSNKKDKERVSCDLCGKVLSNQAVLQKHMVHFHSSNKLFCQLCAQTFETQEEHQIHRTECTLKRKVQRSRRYECTECDFIPKSQIGLRAHLIEIHKIFDE